MQTKAELLAQIAELERLEQIEREEKLNSVKPIWKFTFLPTEKRYTLWLEVRPNSGVVVYTLRGTILNKKEMELVGHTFDRFTDREGAMNYLVNRGYGNKIIKADGGGRIWITDENVYSKIEHMLNMDYTDGDITEIIVSQPKFQG
jgi:hypothetical protein